MIRPLTVIIEQREFYWNGNLGILGWETTDNCFALLSNSYVTPPTWYLHSSDRVLLSNKATLEELLDCRRAL